MNSLKETSKYVTSWKNFKKLAVRAYKVEDLLHLFRNFIGFRVKGFQILLNGVTNIMMK